MVPSARLGVRKAAFAAVLSAMLLNPLLVLFGVFSIAAHTSLFHVGTCWFSVWGLAAVWLSLDAAALLAWVGRRPDPLGPRSLALTALGALNVASTILYFALSAAK